ncbi:MAG: hypothetical protein JWO38_6478 [Gemmataceae bacterium]|nr:hypothetical protein [Gemmataceae bacterium]
MSRFTLIASATLVALAGGCRSSPRHALAIEYHPGQKPETFKAPYDATYKLFATDEAGLSLTPIDQSSIERRYHVGFVRQPDGALVGYAGGRKISLPEGHYRWQITPETRVSRADFLCSRIVEVLGIPVAILVRIGKPIIEALPHALYGMARASGSTSR